MVFLFLDHLFDDDEVAAMQHHMASLRDSDEIKQKRKKVLLKPV